MCADVREPVRGDGVERDTVGVAEQGLPRDQGRGEGQALARPQPSLAPLSDEQERDADQEEAPRLGGRHPPRQHGGDGAGGITYQQLIDVQVPAEQMLAERDDADHRHRQGASLGGEARPRRVAPGPLPPERGTRQDEAQGGVGLHHAEPREDALDGSDAEHPAEEDEAAHGDDEGARPAREGVQPRDERRIELARARRQPDPRS